MNNQKNLLGYSKKNLFVHTFFRLLALAIFIIIYLNPDLLGSFSKFGYFADIAQALLLVLVAYGFVRLFNYSVFNNKPQVEHTVYFYRLLGVLVVGLSIAPIYINHVIGYGLSLFPTTQAFVTLQLWLALSFIIGAEIADSVYIFFRDKELSAPPDNAKKINKIGRFIIVAALIATIIILLMTLLIR